MTITTPPSPSTTTRIALGVRYNGQAFNGWQSQPCGNTVQDQLELALGEFTQTPISTLCAGRTDAGVHGWMQVVHFDTAVMRHENAWVRGTNAILHKDIAVQWAKVVPPSFHCRASALSRRYAYLLLESPVRPSVERGRVGWVFQDLDQQQMVSAAQILLGTHDFSAFRAAACQAISPIKDIRRIDIHRQGPYWRFEFEANAFLHHMIRNIMGCLIWIGQGKKPVEWMASVLESRSRQQAAPTFSPDGLYFLGPTYASSWDLPQDTSVYHPWP